MINQKNKYRNPLLHGGKCIFEIESDINKLRNIALYLKKNNNRLLFKNTFAEYFDLGRIR